MKVLVGAHPSPKDGLPDRATPDCGKKCTSHSSQTPELPNLLNDTLPSAERLGEESNSPLSLQVPDVKSCRLSGHFPETDIATTRDTQELKERQSVDHSRVQCIQRVCCSISMSEAS